MKRSSIYEIEALVLALVGVLMFGFGIFPFINSTQFGFAFGSGYRPASVFSVPASMVVMWIAWRLSQEAQRLKKEEDTKG
jgi:predicted Co/Zn/Cd cation transporter (cation efflux family)